MATLHSIAMLFCVATVLMMNLHSINGQYNNQPNYGNVFKDAANTVVKGFNSAIDIGKNIACVAQHDKEFKKCNERMDKFLDKKKDTSDIKVSFFSYEICNVMPFWFCYFN